MCCENPLELDCISSCDDLVLPVLVTTDSTIKTSFNGSNFNVSFAINLSGYAVVDKTNLNEDYTYTFGVYGADGEIDGCYKISIHPAAICCESEQTPSTEHVVMDVANLNNDLFIANYITAGYVYGYQCVAAKYNGKSIGLGSKIIYTTSQLVNVPVQIAPRDTIPAHDEAGGLHLTYDKNWIDFLQSLPIAEFITFRPSPFGGVNSGLVPFADYGFPSDALLQTLLDPIGNFNPVYGEGFQIEFPKGATFSFKINFIYSGQEDIVTVENPYGTEYVGHNIVYKDNAYYIDGALVYPANMRIIQNV